MQAISPSDAADIAEYRETIIAALADIRLGKLMEEEGDDGDIRAMLINGCKGYNALTDRELLDAAAGVVEYGDEAYDAMVLLSELVPLPPFEQAEADDWLTYVRAVSPSELGHKEAWSAAEEAYEKHRGIVPEYTKP